MKKQLIALGIIMLMLLIGFSGCFEEKISKTTDTKSDLNDKNKVIYISGIVDKNDSFSWLSVDVFENRTAEYPNSSEGNYSIVLIDSNEKIVKEIRFDIDFDSWMSVDPIGWIPTNVSSFAFTIPFPDIKEGRLAKIQLKHNDSVIAERTISAYAPAVKVIFPNGGEELTIGKNYTILWEGNDLDGDKLEYSVYYRNNGAWHSIMLDTTQTQYTWNTTGLNPSAQCKIRIIANDGFNTEIDESDETFTLN